MGRLAVLAQRWQTRPTSQERRRGLNPRLAAVDKWRRKEALQANARFLKEYTAAREAFRAGLRAVLFPPGTYWLKRFADVLCEQLPYLSVA